MKTSHFKTDYNTLIFFEVLTGKFFMEKFYSVKMLFKIMHFVNLSN